MKKSVLFFAALVCMMVQTVSTFANDRIIPAEQLPATAKSFIQKTFPGQAVSFAKIDKDFGKTWGAFGGIIFSAGAFTKIEPELAPMLKSAIDKFHAFNRN